jgi:cytoskeleton protein RodZ
VGFGERLRSERERQNYTLDDVAASTKISTRMLRALEEEKFNQLPGGIFNKGFVRAYATFLRLDEEQAVADYLEAAGEAPPASVVATRVDAPPPDFRFSSYGGEAPESAGFPWKWLAALLLLAAVGFSGWRYFQRERRDQEASASFPSTVPQPTSAPSAAPPAGEANNAAASGPASGQSQNAAGPTANAATSSPVSSSRGVSENSTQPSTQAPPANPTAATPGSFTVSLTALEPSWVSIVVDGTPVESTVLPASTTKSVTAQRRVTIRAGNIGGLALSFNGQSLPSQGPHGQPKTLTFAQTGLVPPYPQQ